MAEITPDDFESTEELWAEVIRIMKLKLSTEIELCNRVTMHYNIRQKMVDYFGEAPHFDEVCEKCVDIHMLFENMIKNIMELKYEQFGVEDFKDPFEQLVPTRAHCENDNEIFDALLAFEVVRPYAEQMFQLNRLVIEHKQEHEQNEDE